MYNDSRPPTPEMMKLLRTNAEDLADLVTSRVQEAGGLKPWGHCDEDNEHFVGTKPSGERAKLMEGIATAELDPQAAINRVKGIV